MSKQGRIRTQEMRKAQAEAAERDARRRRIVTIIGGVVVLALVGAIAFGVYRAAQSGSDDTSSGEVVTPDNVKDDGSIPVGDDAAATTVAVYFDFMCPACGRFEMANGADLDRLLEEGEVKVELRPLSFLDRTSGGTKYSTRSANALVTIADGSPEHVWDFYRALYANQPQEGGTGLSDDTLRDIADEVGVPEEVVDRFADRTYDGWVAEKTEEGFDTGITGTPTVFIDEEEFTELYTPGALAQAIESQ